MGSKRTYETYETSSCRCKVINLANYIEVEVKVAILDKNSYWTRKSVDITVESQ